MKTPFARIALAAVALSLAVPTLAGEVDRRADRQQARIADGVASGELTPRETARMERKEARIDREVEAMRAANGGTLTPAERRSINRQQNRVSRQIYRNKHDAQRR
jgi:hypothetical protein